MSLPININNLLKYCIKPKKRKEILEVLIGVTNQTSNFNKFIAPLIEKRLLDYTIKNSPTSKGQQYFTTILGEEYLFRNK